MCVLLPLVLNVSNEIHHHMFILSVVLFYIMRITTLQKVSPCAQHSSSYSDSLYFYTLMLHLRFFDWCIQSISVFNHICFTLWDL